MKQNNIKITRSFANVLQLGLKKALSRPSRMTSSLNQKWFSALVKKWGFRLVSLSLHSSSKKIHARVQLFHRFGNYLFVMSKRHGITYTVKYLKACQLAVQKAIAGQPLTSLRELEPDLPLPRLTNSGLPRIIQLRDRSAILGGGYSVIRLWLSFFSIYRVIKAPFKTKLNTITDAFSGNSDYLSELKRLVPNGMKVFQAFYGKMNLPEKDVKSQGILPILKASSGSKVSFAKILLLPKALRDANLWGPLVEFATLQGNYYLVGQLKLLDSLATTAYAVLGYSELFHTHTLGKLSFKEEAAGKLRIFAMVDCLTQSALHGLHSWIFELLRRIPNDGTFDQEASFKRAQDKAAIAGVSFGYDLSSATDRLPIELQEAIIAHWFSPREAELWRMLLVDRDYHIVESKQTKQYGLKPGPYRYAVGQPMGAYSSWAMLAVTHHFIVQWAYHQAYPLKSGWFEGYELLGDDIVIFDKVVAEKYLEIMRQLGVEINLSKSVVSNPGTVVEFAKRTSVKGKDVSAISLKMIEAATDLKTKVQVAFYLGLKTGLGIVNYFKALHAFGPSALYKNSIPVKAINNAEARIVSQLVQKDGTNLVAYLSSNINQDSPESFFEGEVMAMKPGKANRIVHQLIQGKEISLSPTLDQQDMFEYLSYDLKTALSEKIGRHYTGLLDKFQEAIPLSVDVLLTPWLEDRNAFTKRLSLDSSVDQDVQLARYEQLRESIEYFVWVVWFGPALFDGFNSLSKVVGLQTVVPASKYSTFDASSQSMILDQHQQVLMAISELFTETLSDPAHTSHLPVEVLYELLWESENLSSYPKRFKYAWDKLKGVVPEPVTSTKDEFAISLLTDLQKMMKKANDHAQYAEIEGLHHLY